MNDKIRDIHEMPLQIKLNYSRILSLMATVDRDHNQLKIGAFYRIMNKIKLPATERVDLLKQMMQKRISFEEFSKELQLENQLNDQERNIFRFSLMKDLIIIMNADYVITEGEERLIEQIQNYFNISEEQFSFFQEEYEMDCSILESGAENDQLKEIGKKSMAAAASLGIPLGLLYYSGNFRGLGCLGALSGLKAIGMKKKTKKHALVVGLAGTIALGMITYKAVDYLLSIKKDERTNLWNITKESMERLHQETIDNIYSDMDYFHDEVLNHKEKEADIARRALDILRRTVATLENTGAIIL
ncbi:TerB family tellurite resistance protein [Alkaliphilus oremlandii]|uniref:Co-chaperone DjlA N-terminal domain-containing protein n=1 Tax=Alkaliphilus oremlandii (strain OhILAs) TaxID=350688 RepID=A8MIJ3_ALKOO|nr:TerB family tellurite resistance protein [Alkaliphilus oremlandii]ABW19625.1 conserved hypothetical protein [Alkaliphilus oremlandii OhILAs]